MRHATIAVFCSVLVGLLASDSSAQTPQRELHFMPLFPEADLAQPHVMAPSLFVGDDFVDGQWQGIIAASDGRTYFGFSCHGPANNAQFYRYDPKVAKVEHLIDVGVWCGYKDSPGKYNAQGKIHSNIYEYQGKLYCTTTSAHSTFEHPYPGGHFLAYDLKTGAFENFGKVDYEGKGGLLSCVLDPVYQRVYAIHQHQTTLVYLDLKTKKIVEVGPVEDGRAQCRFLITDPNGVLYGSTRDGMIFRYNPATDTRGCLLTRVPKDPNAPATGALNNFYDEFSHWAPMVWDPATKWWYGVRANDEYLFRFRPPADPRSHVGQVEGLAPFGFQPSGKNYPRFGSYGMALRGRTLWYCSYPMWKSMAHLMSYNIDTGKVTDHGPIVTDGLRRVSEIHSMVVGSDGKLHCAAMVWSIKGTDPAKPWADRAGCYFHSRFLTIDVDKDLKR